MCGLVGIVSLVNKPVLYQELVLMADTLKHRGIDGEGFLISNQPEFCHKIKAGRNNSLAICLEHRQHIALGHRRLSITDLNENAAQPMCDWSGRYWIVFNGEIYNHTVLRQQLKSVGYVFTTDHSD